VKWMEVKVTTSQEAKEAVADLLYQLGADGLVIEDSFPATLAEDVEDYSDVPEESFPLEEVRVIAYLPIDESLPNKIDTLRLKVAALPDYGLDPGKGEVTLLEVEDSDWGTAWKAYYRPIAVGQRLLIKPTWEEAEADGRLVIELDPGMAFGTGTHPTTTMCLEALEGVIRGGETVFDVGCGSGILSIAAARLGAGQVLALDKDPNAVKVARENIRQNNVADLVSVRQSDLLEQAAGEADIIVANIIARIIVTLIPQVVSVLRPQGYFIAAGIIADRLPEVTEQLDAYGLRTVARQQEGEWVTLTCQRR
jgi:ribosomal protein L11 methyltransferase